MLKLSDSSPLIKELHAGLYRFSSSSYDERFKVHKHYVREVKVYQLNFPREWNTYRLYCKHFIFDDPYITTLIRKIAYVFDVLTLRLGLDNQLLAVENKEEVQRKWDKTKADLQRNHQGLGFDRYIQSIDDMLNADDKLLSFVSSKEMYGLFLQGLRLQMNSSLTSDYQQIEHIRDRTILTNRKDDNSIVEQYVLQHNAVIEGFQIQDNTQYELLWIG